MEIVGKVNSYVVDTRVDFSFKKKDTKKKTDLVGDEYDFVSTNLPFEIWKKFKGSDVKVTITKL